MLNVADVDDKIIKKSVGHEAIDSSFFIVKIYLAQDFKSIAQDRIFIVCCVLVMRVILRVLTAL